MKKAIVSSFIRAFALWRFVAFPLPLFVLACASEQPLPIPGLKESFHTEIAANGAKRFTYSLEILRAGVPRPFTESGVGGSRMGRNMAHNGGRVRSELQFDRAMEQKLTETGFCRQGYFELERSVYAAGGEVRGECREGAER
ncbi:hypothetical protein [Microbulbifer sp.]|uniref:hypothetical protein n=1 Tax=Microbulbifer sp. TaxID=1908541 RepID=UPI003F3C447B